MKQFWLNFILHLSSYSYRKKKALFSSKSLKTALLMIQILCVEILMAIVALPFYFLVGPDKTKIPRSRIYQIKIYRLRRRITLAAFAVFLLLAIANIAFGVLSFTRYPQKSQAALQSGLIKTGKYKGNGNDDRVIDSLGFKPDMVIVTSEQNTTPILKTLDMEGDTSKPLETWAGLSKNLIQKFTDNGFIIGNDQKVNDTGKNYHWAAFKQVEDLAATGSYVGNGEILKINDIGFQPEYVIVAAENGNLAVHRATSMKQSYFIEGDEGASNRITKFTNQGFIVGDSSATNSDGVTYYYIAWRYLPGVIEQGTHLFKLFAEPKISWGK